MATNMMRPFRVERSDPEFLPGTWLVRDTRSGFVARRWHSPASRARRFAYFATRSEALAFAGCANRALTLALRRAAHRRVAPAA